MRRFRLVLCEVAAVGVVSCLSAGALASPAQSPTPRRGLRAVTGSSSPRSTRPAARSAHLRIRTPLLVPASFSERTRTRRFLIRRAGRTVRPHRRGASGRFVVQAA